MTSTYFDPTNPLFLSRDPSFNGVKVDISEEFVDFVEKLSTLMLVMHGRIYESGATEDFAQGLAEDFARDLGVLINAQSNSK